MRATSATTAQPRERATPSREPPGLPSPGRLAVAGFACLALFLAVLALPAARESALLFPSLLAFAVGVALLARADGPAGARYAALVVAAYLALLVVLFLASTPFTLGRYLYFVNETPPAWAVAAFGGLLDAAPAALALGVAATAWPWSGKVGRGAIALGGLLLVAFVAYHLFAPPPEEASREVLAEAARQAQVAGMLLSSACAALLAALGLVALRERLDLAWG